ncbi:hypothetical protein MMC08_005388 [Hypocenomyce scalaris]|nr:hypothetical protein [Hypocenomyce scalaris]
MRPSFNSVGIFILGSLTLLASLANAYLEVPCLETNASGHGKDRNITIEFTFFDQANNGSTTCNSSFLPSTANRTYYPGPPYSIACKDADFRWYFNSFDNSSSFSLYLQHSYNDTA